MMNTVVTPDDTIQNASKDIQSYVDQINKILLKEKGNLAGTTGSVGIHICLWVAQAPEVNHSWLRWHGYIVDQYRKAGWIVNQHGYYLYVYWFLLPDISSNEIKSSILKP